MKLIIGVSLFSEDLNDSSVDHSGTIINSTSFR